jgi:hypothetical protein
MQANLELSCSEWMEVSQIALIGNVGKRVFFFAHINETLSCFDPVISPTDERQTTAVSTKEF